MNKQPLMLEWLKTKNSIQKTVKKQVPPSSSPLQDMEDKTVFDKDKTKEYGTSIYLSQPLVTRSAKPVSKSKKRT